MPPQHCRRRHRRICPCATPRCHCLTCVGYGGRGGKGGGGRSHYSCGSIRTVYPPSTRLALYATRLAILHPLPLSHARTYIPLRFTLVLVVRKDTLPCSAPLYPSHFIMTRNLCTMSVAVACARWRRHRLHAVLALRHRHVPRRRRAVASLPVRTMRRIAWAHRARHRHCR